MPKVLFFLLSLCLWASQDVLASPEMARPSAVAVAPDGAVLSYDMRITPETIDGEKVLRFLLPGEACDCRIDVEGAVAVAQSMDVTAWTPTGSRSAARRNLVMELSSLQAEVSSLDAQETKLREKEAASKKFCDIYMRRTELKERIASVEKVLKTIPAASSTARLVTIVLGSGTGEGAVRVRCLCRISKCSWTPVYSISCTTDKTGMGALDVRLEAMVKQSTGMDWKGAEVTLVSSEADEVIPTLVPWLVGMGPVSSRSRLGAAAPMMAESSNVVRERGEDEDAVRSTPPSRQDLSGMHASWVISRKGLDQGESRVLLSRTQWNVPLVWTARLNSSESRVFVCAEYEVEGDAFWPEGPASISLDGIMSSTVHFKVEKGKVFLCFGSDPRVVVATKAEPRKSGTAGIIGQNRSWEWAWEYEVRNGRENAVHLRLERPEPRSVNSEYKVEMKSTPEPHLERHALVWEADLPARGVMGLKHEVKVTASKDAGPAPVAP